jgi:D-sedoheptulose 7-phosphate isomerase
MGNGGSATLSSHFATDLSKTTLSRVYDQKIKRFRVISLTDNVGLLTAYSNDVSYDEVFSQQLSNLVRDHDIIIVITGSGNSPNILKAVDYAKKSNAITIGLLGFDGGKVKPLLDHSILVPSNHYGRIEAMHSMIHHLIVAYLKDRIDAQL